VHPPSPRYHRILAVGLAIAVALWAILARKPRSQSPAPAPTAGAPAAAPAAADRPSIVLFTLDTTRADHLGCYGFDKARTPRLDELAAAGTRFALARTTCPLTLPAHSSILTGLEPFRHGVRDNAGYRLSDANATLAELLGAAGYETAGFVAAVVLGRASGIAQGFTTFEEPRRGNVPERVYPSVRATEVNAKVFEWFAARDRSKPFFLWIHYYDAHSPYEPTAEYAMGAASPYDGEISAEDAAVGEVLDRLADERDSGRLLTIVTADHGEGLGFRGEQTHAIYVYEPLVHVPLIVRWPAKGGGDHGGSALVGAVRADPVSVVDVFPTVLDAAGVAAPLRCDGVGLARAPQPDRRVYSESLHPWLNHGWSPLYALSGAGLKYIHSTQPELYAVAPGSVEGDDLVAKRPGDVAELRGELQAFLREHTELGTADGDGRVELDSERQAVLKRIGYVGIDSRGIPLPQPFSLDPDLVRATPERLERYTKATTPGLGFTLPQAIEELKKIVEEEPSEIAVLDCLGRLLVETKRTKEAHAPLERLLKLRPGHADGWGNLGACHQIEGDYERAIECYKTALDLDPTSPGPLVNLAIVLDHLGRKDEAAEVRKKIEAQKKQ
jgi:arylsulfatase A-like enzyme